LMIINKVTADMGRGIRGALPVGSFRM